MHNPDAAILKMLMLVSLFQPVCIFPKFVSPEMPKNIIPS